MFVTMPAMAMPGLDDLWSLIPRTRPTIVIGRPRIGKHQHTKLRIPRVSEATALPPPTRALPHPWGEGREWDQARGSSQEPGPVPGAATKAWAQAPHCTCCPTMISSTRRSLPHDGQAMVRDMLAPG